MTHQPGRVGGGNRQSGQRILKPGRAVPGQRQCEADPDTKPDPDLKVRTALDRAANRIEGKFAGKPLVEASIRRTIGKTYQKLGLNTEALLHLELALELDRLELGNENHQTLETMHALGDHYLIMGKPELAESMLVAALDGMSPSVRRRSS